MRKVDYQLPGYEFLIIAKEGHFRCKVCKSYCFMMTDGDTIITLNYETASRIDPQYHELPDDFDILDLTEGECPGCSDSPEYELVGNLGGIV